MAELLKRIIQAKINNLVIGDLGIKLRKIGDSIDLLVVKTFEEIMNSKSLDEALTNDWISLYDENGNLLTLINAIKATNHSSLLDSLENIDSTDGMVDWDGAYLNIDGGIRRKNAADDAKLIIAPKGLGAFQLSIAGNNRGNNAVDLQMSRSVDTEVASGPNSFIAGGKDNTASGYTSHSEGFLNISAGDHSHTEGVSNSATSDASHAEGSYNYSTAKSSHAEGNHTLANGNFSHAEGNFTTASGEQSHAEGYTTQALGVSSHAEGHQTIARANWSHAEGLSGTTNHLAEHSHGSRLINSGALIDSQIQYTRNIASILTQNNTPTLLDYTSVATTIDADGAFDYLIRIVARKSDGSQNASFIRRCLISMTGGTVSLIGSVQTIGTDIGSNGGNPPAGWAVSIGIDDTAKTITITVTGAAVTNVGWCAIVETVENFFPTTFGGE